MAERRNNGDDRRSDSSPLECFTCLDHSGVTTRLNIGIALLTFLCGLFSYSSFVQLPQLKAEIMTQLNQHDKRITKCEDDIKLITTQRNRDHMYKDPLVLGQ